MSTDHLSMANEVAALRRKLASLEQYTQNIHAIHEVEIAVRTGLRHHTLVDKFKAFEDKIAVLEVAVGALTDENRLLRSQLVDANKVAPVDANAAVIYGVAGGKHTKEVTVKTTQMVMLPRRTKTTRKELGLVDVWNSDTGNIPKHQKGCFHVILVVLFASILFVVFVNYVALTY
ncbi:hypothetical protein QBC39DRAFT_381428 [Podospora conica]|nr:hypothetical protein QBC39DRAFT_381428 [Schizothecium conicum]